MRGAVRRSVRMARAQDKTIDAFASTLNDPANAVINFQIGTIQVSPTRLSKVAGAIKAKKIKVEVGGTGSFSATYEAARNTLTVASPDVNSELTKALIVHEAVHAICDLEKMTYDAVDGEAAGYTAQALYFRKHYGKQRLSGMGDMKLDAVLATAFDLADSILGNATEYRAALINSLRKAIAQTTHYSGISGRKTGNG